ncbi:MAG: S41 family peptidase [Calditrichia bacterium]
MPDGKRTVTWFSLFMFFFSIGWFVNSTMASNETNYHKIDKGLVYMKKVFETVSRSYVDKLDPENLSKSAIDGMLNEFDPYTVFFEDPGSHQLQMITRGKYGGVGMEISIQDDRIVVISPMEGTPAQRAGVRAGDILYTINGLPTTDMTTEDASRQLRGKIGTTVQIEMERAGLDERLSFELTREEIVLKDVTFSDFIKPGVAYFRLSAFSDKAGKELREAVFELEDRGEIEKVILDLRGNPGGLLTAAVDVLDIFLPENHLVVSTRGSHENEHKFYTETAAILPNVPLVALVNQSSASASEIVAGAIQDLDRGVVIGEATFGKGLVQKVYPVDKISQAYLKITTAKYYIPSGRSIQKEDYKKNNTVFTDRSDSVEYNQDINYYTANGRIVHSGSGITPDIPVVEEHFDRFIQHLLSKAYFFRYTVDYLNKYPEKQKQKSIIISPKMLADFEKVVLKDGFKIELEGEKELKKFLDIAEKKDYNSSMEELVSNALKQLERQKRTMFTKNREHIKHMLMVEFAEKLGGAKQRIKMLLARDKQVNQALAVLVDHREYRDILAVGN